MLLCSLIGFYSIPLKKRKAPFVCVLSGLRYSPEAGIVILGQFNHRMASIQIKEKIERELTELLVGATMLHLYWFYSPCSKRRAGLLHFFNKSILWRNPVGFWEVFYAGLNAKRVKPDFMPWDWVCHVINKPIFWLQMELPASQRPWQGLVSFILFEWTASPIQEREVMIFSLYNSTEPHSHITITV